MIYRPLYPDEYEQLKPMFEAQGSEPPMPATSLIVGAIEKGKLVGFIIFQPAWHLEPLWIDPAFKGRVSIRSLVHEVDKHIPKDTTMYSFIPATFEKLAEAATALKFEDTGWKTFKRVT